MKHRLYAAPLEGLTVSVWRRAHRDIFGGADKYFAPFISPNKNLMLTEREKRDLTQGEDNLIPQVLTNNNEYFDWACRTLDELGYKEINLNLGCPSGTVAAKGRGAGALSDLNELDQFLGGAYSSVDKLRMDLSIKTRIGFEDADSWDKIINLYEKYPVHELIVHPRIRTQYYKGEPDRALFKKTLGSTNLSIVYNGDVTAIDDEALDYGCDVMIGRGLISRPALLREIKGGLPAKREELARFHELVLTGYSEYMPGATPLLHRMKEFWTYFKDCFVLDAKDVKRIHKSKNLSEYNAAVEAVIKGRELSR